MLFKRHVRVRHLVVMLIIAAAGLTGCAPNYSSGIQKKATNVYFLSVRLANASGTCCRDSDEAKRDAVAQANTYCDQSEPGQKAEVTSEELGPYTADIYFTCVSE